MNGILPGFLCLNCDHVNYTSENECKKCKVINNTYSFSISLNSGDEKQFLEIMSLKKIWWARETVGNKIKYILFGRYLKNV